MPEKFLRTPFPPTYIKANGIISLKEADIPLPSGFKPLESERASIFFPPQSRAGDHYHKKRSELFVGFGEGMEILIESEATGEVSVFQMDPSHNDSNAVAFYIPPGTPHAVRNIGEQPGFLLELADHTYEKVEHRLSVDGQ